MFDVGGTYANRIGTYTVLSMGPRKMKVRYEDGTEAELNIGIQERIWENIVAEREAQSQRSRKRKGSGAQARHYIKSVAIVGDEDLNPVGIRAKVTPTSKKAPGIKVGDRFIYYSVSARAFFAVATITGDPQKTDAKDFAELDFEDEVVSVYPIDIDAFAVHMSQAVWLDSVELESQPNFRNLLTGGEIYLSISEDDFELLAESLTEFVEGDDDDNLADDDDDDNELEDTDLLLEDDDLDL